MSTKLSDEQKRELVAARERIARSGLTDEEKSAIEELKEDVKSAFKDGEGSGARVNTASTLAEPERQEIDLDRNHYMLPEAYQNERGGAGWDVHEGPGATNVQDREMMIPLDSSEHARRIRLHEGMHGKISPEDLEGVLKRAAEHKIGQQAVQKCEDYRVHKHLTECGFDLSAPTLGHEMQMLKTQISVGGLNPTDAALLCTGSLGTGDHDAVAGAILEAANDLPSEHQPYASRLREAVRISKYMKDQMDQCRMEDFEQFTMGSAAQLQGLLDILSDMDKENKKADSDKQNEDKEKDKENGDGESGDGEEGESGDEDDDASSPLDDIQARDEKRSSMLGEWGNMTLEEPPRPHTLPGKLRVRSHVAADTGTTPRNVTRFCLDGRVFRRRGKRPKMPSILLDVSGSMSLGHRDIREIVTSFPHALVAAYSGSQTTGTLRLMVKGQKHIEENLMCRPGGGNNCIDGPALEWLAKQPEPRVWISDEGVTGKYIPGAGMGEAWTKNLKIDALRICRKHRIVRFREYEDALEYLKTNRVPKHLRGKEGRCSGYSLYGHGRSI